MDKVNATSMIKTILVNLGFHHFLDGSTQQVLRSVLYILG